MKGSRPKQSELTKGNDLSKTEETRGVLENMVDGLNVHSDNLMHNLMYIMIDR